MKQVIFASSFSLSNKLFYIPFSFLFKVASATKQQLLKMCHLRHKLRTFLFCRKVMLRSQDIHIFVF